MPYKHFWPGLYGSTYILIGSLGFFLPTQTTPEIVTRVLFILLGIGLLISYDRPKLASDLLILGVVTLTLWIFAALIIIAGNANDPVYRIHLFYLPLWGFFGFKHYKAIRELNE